MQSKRVSVVSMRGATIIELLVLIVATAVLTVLVIVTMRGVKESHLAMRDVQNLRLSAADLIAFASENDEVFLNVGEPGSLRFRSLFPASSGTPADLYGMMFWSLDLSWNGVLAMLTGDAHSHWQSAYGLSPTVRPNVPGIPLREPPAPGSREYAMSLSRFRYTVTLASKPELWHEPPLSLGFDTLHMYAANVRLSQVRHPASKGILIHRTPVETLPRHHVAFVDGSASFLGHDRVVTPASRPVAAESNAPGAPVQHTRDGHHGRDR